MGNSVDSHSGNTNANASASQSAGARAKLPNIPNIPNIPKPDLSNLPKIHIDRESRVVRIIVSVIGVLIAAAGVVSLVPLINGTITLAHQVASGAIGIEIKSLTFVLECVNIGVQILALISLIIFGVMLVMHKRAGALRFTYALIVLTILEILLTVALHGLDVNLIEPSVQLVILIVLSATIDPTLQRERREQWAQRRVDEHDEYEKSVAENMEGRDLSGKGYISLNFFNIFWLFVAASIIGLILETIFHLVIFHHYQDRAGMLWGPLSPIYGFGALIMTVCLNRFYKSNPIFIFFVSAILGGAFEWFTSWFMQTAFGITAWNYTGMWLSIGGRTCGLFMFFWGLLGLVWIKWLLPLMLRLIQLIPWNVRYWLTAICFVFIVVDGVMTLMALDAWYSRLADISQNTPVSHFFATYFDNAFMSHRFQTMTLDPSSASRL